MPFEKLNLESLAKRLGVNYSEVREKQSLIYLIVKIRKELGITQLKLSKMADVSQARIAKIESGVGTRKVTFDVLFGLLNLLGYDYKIIAKKNKVG